MRTFASLVLLIAGACCVWNEQTEEFVVEREQQTMIGGGGTGYGCYGVNPCIACTACTGCAYWQWSYMGTVYYWECLCLTAGNSGCATAGTVLQCATSPNGNCWTAYWGGGTGGCGVPSTPDCKGVAPIVFAPFWKCTPSCFPSGSTPTYCQDCTGTPY